MTYDDDNRLLTVNGQNVYSDSDGNLTNAPLTNSTFVTYTYDARNRLIQVGPAGPSGPLGYTYDPAGNRVALTNGTNVVRFVINPNAALSQILMRIKGGVTNYYVYGVGLLYEATETATSTNTLTYHYDYRGSTVALTDGNGIPTDRIEYSAYGTTTYRAGTNDTPFLFNGRYGVMTDPNGLLYMRARYYNPYLCRFLNADPSGFSGGLNFYAYANGNPVSYLDPFGLCTGNEGFCSWLTGVGLRLATTPGVDPTGIGGQLLTSWGLVNKYGLSGYAAENGVGNTLVMMTGEIAGTTPFAEGWYGTDIGYGTSLTTVQSVDRLVRGGVTMASWVAAGYGTARGLSTPAATTATADASTLTTVSRWGRPGLQPGDWVMNGPASRWNYLRSGKWESYHPWNEPAPFNSGLPYDVPPSTIEWPSDVNWFRGFFGQRIYTGPEIPPPQP